MPCDGMGMGPAIRKQIAREAHISEVLRIRKDAKTRVPIAAILPAHWISDIRDAAASMRPPDQLPGQIFDEGIVMLGRCGVQFYDQDSQGPKQEEQ
jgi:hypothetical protein